MSAFFEILMIVFRFCFAGVGIVVVGLSVAHISGPNHIGASSGLQFLATIVLALLILSLMTTMLYSFKQTQPGVATNTIWWISLVGFAAMGLLWGEDIVTRMQSYPHKTEVWKLVGLQATFFALNLVYYPLRKSEMEKLNLPDPITLKKHYEMTKLS